ncbi:MAG: nicotinate-nicotinamide nucleotide adenylyltransferase [Clostridia bacterium]|nr:nicotinate-nicotinamide nucleotide adenylyltransferase [Clostridia bacterium]
MRYSYIVVMGGSFNPPTIAHFRLMETALNMLEGSRGIFVPSSEAYLHKKFQGKEKILSEAMRTEMLATFGQIDARMHVDGRELGTTVSRGHTVDTLEAIQREYPESEILIIFGGDKIQGLPRWPSFQRLITQFRVILFRRKGADPAELIAENADLMRFQDRFVILDPPDGMEGISSSKVRASDKNARCMLTEPVYALYREAGEMH